ncbi:MAG TPA: peptidoglycan editing factor PgeF [Gammaproteobacteria bacterium]|nr:peptidoglycan editing factor PgeF [Gammaproteobacteria bacterium]
MNTVRGDPAFIIPDWPAPTRVCALATTRRGGVSRAPFDSFNLGHHVGDDEAHVAENRRLLMTRAALREQPCWLEQVHGNTVVRAERVTVPPRADAVFATVPGMVCAVLTADCLPVLFCDREASVVAAAHAGWRGLAAGVLDATVRALGKSPARLLAWLGPAIGRDAYEVGPDVRDAFVGSDPLAAAAFRPAGAAGKWFCDLYALARLKLAELGVLDVYGGDFCTFTERERFFSFRRDGRTGRQATLIWLADSSGP